jgi:hypothetical protein
MVSSEMFTRKDMFALPLSLSKPMPVIKWFWKEGNNKMLPPEERIEQKNLPNLEGYKNLLKEHPETSLVEFLFKNAK